MRQNVGQQNINITKQMKVVEMQILGCVSRLRETKLQMKNSIESGCQSLTKEMRETQLRWFENVQCRTLSAPVRKREQMLLSYISEVKKDLS